MVSVIILAAGKGRRMHQKTAKQFLEICGKPLLYYSLKTFDASIADEIILVTRKTDIEYCKKEVVGKYGFGKVKRIISGGDKRYNSVWAGIKAADKRNNVIMIHDSARPFVTNRMILDSISEVRRSKACTVGMPVKDTIKVIDEAGFGVETPDRNTLYQIQTPQTFDRNTITEAYRRLFLSGDIERGISITDDTMIVEKYMDVNSKIIEGSYKNMKVTTPEDLVIAEAFIKNAI